MNPQVRTERQTQNRVLELLKGLGYRYLGNWEHQQNKNIEEELLRANLAKRGYSEAHIAQAIRQLVAAIDTTGKTLFQANLHTYNLLRYGAKVQVAAGVPHETVHFIDWNNQELNDFAVAEEVTLKSEGGYRRRPDVVLYVNGLALVVLELKRGSVEVADGIRQLISNQDPQFNQSFFATVQFVLAGSDSQGLYYGTVGTPEEFFVKWKGLHASNKSSKPEAVPKGDFLDASLVEMCDRTRLFDLIHNCIIFDAGLKKVPRMHQYAAFKAAQERLKKLEGGVIWHTQGSGKSILMVLVTKWLLEHDPSARILIITDRDELDKQIANVLKSTAVISQSDGSPRVTSRHELLEKLKDPRQRVMCALLHKIDPKDLTGQPPKTTGQFYVLVDECHRTQGGDMNHQMKRWFARGIFVGFSGTPLLRSDKPMTTEVFGTFIHTYKFDEAVEDKVVLDLKYEARNVPQRLTSSQAVDQWFDRHTKGLNDYQQAVLKKKWASLEELMSAEDRKRRILFDILVDFDTKPRLASGRGTAMLVAASIYDACHYYQIAQTTPLKNGTAIITSYEPNPSAISREPEGSDERYKFDTYKELLKHESRGLTPKQYTEEMKRRFIEEPQNCKLLIVVSKLLTGFDAPSCSYIYLDNELRDHNLFQAICRTNRLDGSDKDYGYIVDYKELFQDVQNAISVYTSDQLAVDEDGDDGNVTLKDWKAEGKANLDAAWEVLYHLCEPVAQPKEIEQFILYFCGDAKSPHTLKETEPLRISFYKATATFLRAYAAVAHALAEVGYSVAEVTKLEQASRFYAEMRKVVKKASGEELDTKPYEQDMRQLINMYIQSDMAEEIGKLSEVTLVEAIVETGIHDVIAQQINQSGKYSSSAVAETIINNVRKTIIRDQLTDPQFYDRMSALLDDLIQQRQQGSLAYEDFLREAEQLIRGLARKGENQNVPSILVGNSQAIAVYNNLATLKHDGEFICPDDDEQKARLALAIDKTMLEEAPANWRGDGARERQIQNALYQLLNRDRKATRALFELIVSQAEY